MKVRLLTLTLLLICLVPMQLAAQTTPAALYEWTDVPIGGGGYVSGVQSHPVARDLVYAKTDIGGAYRRDSASGTWIPLTDWVGENNWTYSGIESLALDPHDPDAVYLAAGTYTNGWSGNGAFLLSHDRGRTWKTVPAAFKMGGNEDGRSQGERLVVDPNDGQVLFFGSRKNGLWKSADRGETWTQVKAFPLPDDAKEFGTPFILFDATSGKLNAPTPIIIIGCDSPTTPLFRSTDAGNSWTPISGGGKGMMPHHAAYAADGTIIVAYANGVGPNGVTGGAVFRLEGDGSTWTDITPIKPSKDDAFGYSGVCVDPHDPKTVLVSTLDRWKKGDDIFRSHDNGRTWKSLRENSVRDASAAPWITFGNPDGASFGHWISSVSVDPADAQHVIYVTGWGMWESRDTANADKGMPTHWTFAATGINELVMTDAITPSAGPHVLSTMWDLDGFAHNDVDHSPPGGFFKPWTGRNTSIDFAGKAPNVIVRVFGGQVLGHAEDAAAGGAISKDSGATWSLFAGKPKDAVDGNVAVLADGMTILWTPDGQSPVRSSGRNGDPWLSVTGLPAKLLLIADRVDTNRAYAFDSTKGVLYASSDRGATFKAAATELPTGDCSLKASAAAAGELWLASVGGLFRSTDFGSTFEKLSGLDSATCIGFGAGMNGSKSPAVYTVARAAGMYGFFRSDDAGRSWTRINDDRHQFMEIVAITGDPRVAGRVYLASRSRGLLRGDPAAAGETNAVVIQPNDSHIKYVGRFDVRDPAGPRCSWPASTVTLHFRGRGLQALIGEEGSDEFQVVVDGKPTCVLRPEKGESWLNVASDLSDSEHTVSIVKRTETLVGTVQFKRFALPGGGSLLDIPATTRRIEVIGDSISCGYGNEAASESEHFAPSTENGYRAYGAVAARMVDADYTCIAWSGRKLWPDNTVPEIYDRSIPFDPSSKWDFDKAPKPDAVLINLATNDFANGAPDQAKWTAAYVDLVHRIRALYPQATIYLASGSMMSDYWPPEKHVLSTLKEYLDQIHQTLVNEGDEKVHLIVFDTQDPAVDGLGADYHPSLKTDAKMAAKFADALSHDLGWSRVQPPTSMP